MRSTLGSKQSAAPPTARPPAAVELSPEGVLAAALPGKGDAAVVAFEPLAPGSLTPGTSGENIASPAAVAAAIRRALDEVAPRKRDVTLVVPDRAVRIFVLDFDALPAKQAEVISILRFRLRKMLPFDVEHAGVSYQVLSNEKTETRVLAAVVPGPVLAEYESAVRAAGYEPGSILPSSLAGLAALDSDGPVLAAFLEAGSMTTVIAQEQNVLLYRTLELPEAPEAQVPEIQRDIAVAVAYFEDRLGARPRRLHYAGLLPAMEFGRAIGDSGLEVVDLTEREKSSTLTALGTVSLAGVTGALAGVK
jgi:type IV pilus assembly protein PilM